MVEVSPVRSVFVFFVRRTRGVAKRIVVARRPANNLEQPGPVKPGSSQEQPGAIREAGEQPGAARERPEVAGSTEHG